MDAAEYRLLTTRPDALDRLTLQQTASAMQSSELSRAILEVLAGDPIRKPDMHPGDEWSDRFIVRIPLGIASRIVDRLGDLEASAAAVSGETTPAASRAADLVDVWHTYLESLER